MRTYGRLRELIREKFGTIQSFAKEVKMDTSTLSRKLLGVSDWKSTEIEKIADALEIKYECIGEYFFY